ncbi:hypothetical protein LBMAG49_17100 [Planctomycetota bacterium]|nr:hypothetical protein [Planctomycetota bacterium]GDY02381.1 hypothetical protein LBMAG49_17100 [Planctomycetota bacterium]
MNRLQTQFPLRRGAHSLRSDGMCAMEMVAWLAGEAHSDGPQCTSPVLAAYVRAVNDALPSDAWRERLLRPLVPQLIHTRGDARTERQLGFCVVRFMVNEFVPFVLDAQGLCATAMRLRSLAPVVDAATAAAMVQKFDLLAIRQPAARWVLLRASEGMSAERFAGTAVQVLKAAGGADAFRMLLRVATELARAGNTSGQLKGSVDGPIASAIRL